MFTTKESSRLRVKWNLLIFVLVVLFLGTTAVYADEYTGVDVETKIEGYDKTLAADVVHAYTFEDAIYRLAEKEGIALVFSKNGTKTQINSVQGIKNKTFGATDGWFGFVLRKDRIVQPDDFMSIRLEKDDQVVLYYGDQKGTRIVTGLGFEQKDTVVKYKLVSTVTKWDVADDKWFSTNVDEPVGNVKIHVLVPGGSIKIITTEADGSASMELTKLGMYRFYVEGYVAGKPPLIVKTDEGFFFHGVKNKTKVTRGEAVAFLVNTFKMRDSYRENQLTDLNGLVYAKEITQAYESGLINGYEDGTFRAGNSITLMEFAILLSGLGDLTWSGVPVDKGIAGVPIWAQERVDYILQSGLLDHLEKDWHGDLSQKDLEMIYFGASTL